MWTLSYRVLKTVGGEISAGDLPTKVGYFFREEIFVRACWTLLCTRTEECKSQSFRGTSWRVRRPTWCEKVHPEWVPLSPDLRFRKFWQSLSDARSAIIVMNAAKVPKIWKRKHSKFCEICSNLRISFWCKEAWFVFWSGTLTVRTEALVTWNMPQMETPSGFSCCCCRKPITCQMFNKQQIFGQCQISGASPSLQGTQFQEQCKATEGSHQLKPLLSVSEMETSYLISLFVIDIFCVTSYWCWPCLRAATQWTKDNNARQPTQLTWSRRSDEARLSLTILLTVSDDASACKTKNKQTTTSSNNFGLLWKHKVLNIPEDSCLPFVALFFFRSNNDGCIHVSLVLQENIDHVFTCEESKQQGITNRKKFTKLDPTHIFIVTDEIPHFPKKRM